MNLLRTANAVGLIIVLASNAVIGTKIKSVSDIHDTPFTPAKWTFGVWILIYALLATAVVAQLYDPSIAHDWGPFFLIQCAGIVAWLLLFTRDQTKWAALTLVASTACVGLAYARCQRWKHIRRENLGRQFTSVAFSLYFGWLLLASTLSVCVALNVRQAHFLARAAVWLCLFVAVATTQSVLLDPLLGLTLAWGAFGVGARRQDLVAWSACCLFVLAFVVTQIQSIQKKE